AGPCGSSDLAPVSAHFDDPDIKFEDDVKAQIFRDADFRFKAGVSYPVIAKEEGTQGCATVMVVIGVGGTILDAKVVASQCNQSMGCNLLGDAALRAARNSTFTGASLDGKPIEQNYLIDYFWQLR
ncbi:MAG: energy transducer TonB, partial [Candidatus Eremiobacteraeota bacterium]|nr:energy transducer TonB [Candidatus Eremiobacteraeota bacterium]